MTQTRRTLDPMDLTQLDRILVRVLDVIDDQGGDWDSHRGDPVPRVRGGGAENALAYAVGYLIVYAEPDGPAFLRGMRDRRLVPDEPRRGWGRWRATG